MIEEALKAFRSGDAVLIFDFNDREGETDIAIPAINIIPKDIAMMRMDGGGLICVAIHPVAAEKLKLPFMHDILKVASKNFPEIASISMQTISNTTRGHHFLCG